MDVISEAQKAGYTHIGWVPCVCGYLFFRYADVGLGKKVGAFYINNLEQDSSGQMKRYVLVSSEVDWKDEGGEEYKGKYRVLLIGQFRPDDPEISGKVIILLPGDFFEQRLRPLLVTIQRLVSEGENIGSLIEQLHSVLSSHERFFDVRFALGRAGFVFLSEETEGVEESIKELGVRQAYYYIKYSFHKHRHHDGSAESLTTAHALSSHVGITLINDIKNSLVQMKRDFHASGYRSLLHARGIASYGLSLVEACKQHSLLSDKECSREKRYLENLSMSLSISADHVEKELLTRNSASNSFRSIVLFALALIGPLVIVFQSQIRERADAREIPLVEIIANILQDQGKFISAFIVLLGTYFLYVKVNRKFGDFALALDLFRSGLEKVVHSKRRSYLAVLLIGLIAIAVLVIGLRGLFL